MRVGTRIYLSYSLFVGLLLAVAALNYVMTGTLAEEVEANVAPSHIATAVLGIDRDVARLSYEVHAGQDAAPLYTRIMKRLAELDAENIPGQQRTIIERIQWLLTDYWAKQGELKKLVVARMRLGENALPDRGERMRGRLSQLIQHGVQSGSADAIQRTIRTEETLVLTRVAVSHYYIDPTDGTHGQELSHYHQARRRLARLESDIRALPRTEASTLLARDLQEFKGLFVELEEATNRQLELETQMDQAIAENARLARQLSGDADRSLGELEQKIHAASIETRGVSLVLTLIAALVAALAAHLTGRRITNPLTAIATTISRITKGEHDIAVPAVGSTDEIGDLARAAAEIRELVAWSEAQRWTQSGLAELARALQEARSSQELAEIVVRTLAPKLNTGYAALYLFDQRGRIELAAGFGVACDIEPHPGFAVGEGLVGQCAAQQSAIHLDQVPADYLRIRSGLGEREPLHLDLLPIAHRSMLHGVVEIATFKPLTRPQTALLEETMPLLALHFENIFRHQRTRELLEESQRQAEELQASEEELKTQSEEMQAANERLSEQKLELETANEAAARTAEQLARASRHKSEFLANMSHELRTPLNSLLILSKDLATNAEGNLKSEQIESARVIHDAGTHLLGLINDILDLSKVEAGKLSVQWAEVDLSALLETVRKRFAPAAADKGLEFTVHATDTAPLSGWTDGGRVEQILHNLLSNAVKYTASGSICLTMERGRGSDPGQRWVSFVVADTGAGVDAKDLERMFDAFERLDEHSSGGTGLGLAISRRLARLLGGDITVTSEPGRGSTFVLQLPVERPKHQPLPVPAPGGSATDAAAQRSIVVIEDDPHFAAILCRRAEEKGFFCVYAPRGDAGVDAVRRARPAGVILDLGLPDMNGWQVIDALKADPQLAGIPVHIITGSEPPAEGATHGAASFAVKPVSAEKIARILQRIAATDADGARRVLLVDSDAPTRSTTATLLSERGLEVVEAERGQEALERLAAERFCCVISELRLPDTGAVEMLERAQQHVEALPAVIIFTEVEPTGDQALRLREFTDTVVLKGARASQRLLDEVSLFLHSVSRSANGAEYLPELHEPSFREKTVLLVDDDMRNTFALSKVLRGKGFKVLLAQNGRKALAVLDQAKRVDAVLMDMMMPEMDGIEATRAIRAHAHWRDVPIIALTAKAMRGDRERCLEAGANDYLAKPIDVDELLSRLRVWLAN